MKRTLIHQSLPVRLQGYVLIIRQYDRIIGSAVAILAVFILTYVFLVPTLFKVQEVLTDEQSLAPRLERLSAKEAQLNEINIPLYQTMIARSTAILPASKDYVSLFSTFDSLEVRTGVSLRGTDFQLGTVSTKSAALVKSPVGAFSIPLHVSLVAQPPQILSFIEHMSDLTGRFISLSDIQWVNEGDGSTSVQLSGEAYYLPISTEIGSIDEPLQTFSPDQQGIFDTISALPEPPAAETAPSVPTGKTNLFE